MRVERKKVVGYCRFYRCYCFILLSILVVSDKVTTLQSMKNIIEMLKMK